MAGERERVGRSGQGPDVFAFADENASGGFGGPTYAFGVAQFPAELACEVGVGGGVLLGTVEDRSDQGVPRRRVHLFVQAAADVAPVA